MPVKEIAGSVIGSQPVAMQQKIVDFVWENQLLNFYVLGAQASDRVNGLRKNHVAIVVAMNEEHRRAPGIHGSDRLCGAAWLSA